MKTPITLWKVGVSVLTLRLFQFLPYSFSGSLRILDRTGYAGLQLLPLRSISSRDLANLPAQKVISFEGDWRGKDLSKLRFVDELVNYFFFGPSYQAECLTRYTRQLYRHAIAVDTDLTEPVEVSPGSGFTKQQYLDHAAGIVFDTFHAKEQFPDESELTHFLIELMKGRKIVLIHFQSRSWSELQDFLDGKDTYLTRVTRLVLGSGKNVIVELPPWLIWGRKVCTLIAIRQRLFSLRAENIFRQ